MERRTLLAVVTGGLLAAPIAARRSREGPRQSEPTPSNVCSLAIGNGRCIGTGHHSNDHVSAQGWLIIHPLRLSNSCAWV